MTKKQVGIIISALALLSFGWLFANKVAEKETPEMAAKRQRAEQTISGMKEAAAKGIKATRANLESSVKKAVALLEKEGRACFPKFGGKDSEFIQDNGSYIYVVDMKGNMVMHPVLYKMEGQNVLKLRDKKGKPIIAPIVGIVKTKGKGWYSYWWPKPNKNDPEQKFVYVEKATLPDGMVVGVASGNYDI